VAARRIFVIDLHRHPVAYIFFTTVGKLFLHNRLIREDGALSILRSFTPGELENLAQRAGFEEINLARSFPYRLVLTAAPQSTKAEARPSGRAPAGSPERAGFCHETAETSPP
jgi:hypothetical protein